MSEKKAAKAQSNTPKKSTKAAPEGRHPKEHLVNLILSDGSKIQVMTSWGKEGENIHLDVDPKNHPAWQDGSKNFVNTSDLRVSKFKEKFGDL